MIAESRYLICSMIKIDLTFTTDTFNDITGLMIISIQIRLEIIRTGWKLNLSMGEGMGKFYGVS